METHHSPQRFGRYVLLDRMGAGGMAEVFRAVVPGAEGFRRDLVVKRIASDRARAANFIEMFVHEARISALLHHPNVVQVFDFGQVDGSYFLAMELLRGRDLLAIFRSLRERQRSFPIPVAAHVAHQVALGLGYAHTLTSPDGRPLNIVHRDVSPSNIMLLRTGGVKLLDFGIAQAIGEMDSDDSDRNSFKGKLSYMAPERLRNEPEKEDGRVDVFALGAVLWEMLAGRRLFHGKTELEKVRSVLDRAIPAPSTIRPEVPAELDRIVLKALARDRDDRYATAQDMADDLEDVVSETKYHSRMLPALLNSLFGTAPSAAHLALSTLSPELMACEPLTTPGQTPALSSGRGSQGQASPSESGADFPENTIVETAGRSSSRWAAVTRRASGAVGLKMGAKLLAIVALILAAGTIAVTARSTDSPDARARRARFPAIDALASTPPLIATGSVADPVAAPLAPSGSPTGLSPAPLAAGPVVVPAPAPRASAPMVQAIVDAVATAISAIPVQREPAAVAASSSTTTASKNAITRRAAVRRVPQPRVTAAKPAGAAGNGRITRGLSIDPFAEAATRGARR